nr:hypothetical protein AJKBNOON_00002 [Methanosarcinales archaeon ANME-2c ERB4]QNO43176.1 hypothetical protein AKPPFACA_00005 [Methanosarcinales archaeon ANME-2c ERB4]
MKLDWNGDLWSTRHIWIDKPNRLYFDDANSAYIYQDGTTNALTFYDTVLGAAKTLTELFSPAGTNGTSFIIDQDNVAAGVNTALKFNRGTTAGDARLLWDETNDRFELDAVEGTTIGSLRIDSVILNGSIKFDDTTGKIKIEENDSTGDMEFTVQTGDAFVFKTVA